MPERPPIGEEILERLRVILRDAAVRIERPSEEGPVNPRHERITRATMITGALDVLLQESSVLTEETREKLVGLREQLVESVNETSADTDAYLIPAREIITALSSFTNGPSEGSEQEVRSA
ncbi:MAG: hypothetical protein V1907_02735 [Candidatus Kerfeldbacteria bacterium]